MDNLLTIIAQILSKSDAEGKATKDLYDTEFLNTIKVSRVPNHKLTHKVGTPI